MAKNGPHKLDCLRTRYLRLPADRREWFPADDFRSRDDLCSCGADPDARGNAPEYAVARQEAEETVDGPEGPIKVRLDP